MTPGADTRPLPHGERLPITHPYLLRLASRGRRCPECGTPTAWSGTLNPDAAYEACPACGWLATRLAPAPPRGVARRPAEVIPFRPDPT